MHAHDLLSSLAGCNLTGNLPSSIGAWVDIETFYVPGNFLRGPLPETIKAWKKVGNFQVWNNHLNGGLLPALDLDAIGATACQLFNHFDGGTNAYNCPWPAGAVQKCFKCSDPGCLHWTHITNEDCTPLPTPSPTPPFNNCTGASTKLAPAQCDAWIDFHDATGGDSWEYYLTGKPFCRTTRTDPCSCGGNDGTKPVCSADKTAIQTM
jgi:hypothetical protein